MPISYHLLCIAYCPLPCQGAGPGPFGVLRQPTSTSTLQNTLKSEVKTRNEDEADQREGTGNI